MFNHYSYLYVEDDASSRDAMKLVFNNVMSVDSLTIFEDSADFMNRLQAIHPQPDLILMDIHMEPLDGFTMLKMLRGDPRYQKTTVVALTASVMNEEIMQLQLAGFDGAISKPLVIHEFPGLIKRILEGEETWYVS